MNDLWGDSYPLFDLADKVAVVEQPEPNGYRTHAGWLAHSEMACWVEVVRGTAEECAADLKSLRERQGEWWCDEKVLQIGQDPREMNDASNH